MGWSWSRPPILPSSPLARFAAEEEKQEVQAKTQHCALFSSVSCLSMFLMSTAPEVQLQSQICMQSDMFSLGMVITAIYNHGRPIMQANNSNTSYQRQLETVSTSKTRLTCAVFLCFFFQAKDIACTSTFDVF